MTFTRVIVRWLSEPTQQVFDDALDVECREIPDDRVQVRIVRAVGVELIVRPRREFIGIKFGEEQRRCCGG